MHPVLAMGRYTHVSQTCRVLLCVGATGSPKMWIRRAAGPTDQICFLCSDRTRSMPPRRQTRHDSASGRVGMGMSECLIRWRKRVWRGAGWWIGASTSGVSAGSA